MTNHIRIEAVEDYLVFEGTEYRQTDGMGLICRVLKERDLSIKTLEVYRGDMLCLTVDVHKRAERILTERDKGGLAYDKFVERPKYWKKA